MEAREGPALEAFPSEVVERAEQAERALAATGVRQVKPAARTLVSTSKSTRRIAVVATKRASWASYVAMERVLLAASTAIVPRRITSVWAARVFSNVRYRKSIAARRVPSSHRIPRIAERAETTVCPGTHVRVVRASRAGQR